MLSSAEGRLITGLHRRKTRETQGFFLAEGVRVVEELVQADYDLRLAVVSTSLGDNERGQALRRRLAARTTVREVQEHELKRIAATDQPQGIVVVARVPAYSLASLRVGARSQVLVADAVQDPGNLGTLIRIADAFAADAVITLPGTVDTWNPKVVRASAGSSFHLPVMTSELGGLQAWLQEQAFDVVGAAMEGEPAEQVRFGERVALLVGNEGAGLSAEARALVTRLVSVPMPGRAESLNVAVASGILMYILARR